MQAFRYLAINDAQRSISGELQAESVAEAIARLEADGLHVQSIALASLDANAASTSRSTVEVGVEQAALESHLATILPRVRDLSPALRAYRQELPATRQRQLDAMLRTLEQQDVAVAAIEFARLPDYWIPLLSAASASGDPGQILSQFLDESDQTSELRRQRWLLWAYPAFISLIALLVLFAVSMLVVPAFRDIFRDFGLRLPWITQAVLDMADWIQSGTALLTAGAIALVIVAVWFVGRRAEASGSVGVFGFLPFGRANSQARFAQHLADLLDSSVGVPNALRIAGYAMRNRRLQRAAWRLAGELEQRQDFIIVTRPLSRTIVHALAAEVSERSRIRLLREISRSQFERAEAWASWTHGLFEPLAIVVVGGLVGVTVLAIFMPLFSLLRGLSG